MSKKKLLVIDDEKDFCLLLKKFFAKKGFDIHISHYLQEGMKMLEALKPDILILDNNLPDGLGWKKAEFIYEKFPKLKLILISAYHPDNSLAIKYPSIKIYEKPIDLVELNNHL